MRGRGRVLTIGILIVCGTVAMAQSPAPPAPPTFEAASIRLSPAGTPRGIDYRFYDDRFVGTALTVSQLIEQAYAIEGRELTGGPDWIRGDRFDVMATAGSAVPRDRLRLMLQSLLAERFQLELSRETRPGTVYSLTAPNRRNLKSPADPKSVSRVGIIRDDGNGYLKYRYEGRNAPIAMLIKHLAAQLGAPVTDATSITGNHDFVVQFAYENPFGGLEPDPNVPTIFTALENDLGLKLVAGKGPVTMYVITRASRPSEN
jgi:uncharacterized protein (TIGR03435 family)